MTSAAERGTRSRSTSAAPSVLPDISSVDGLPGIDFDTEGALMAALIGEAGEADVDAILATGLPDEYDSSGGGGLGGFSGQVGAVVSLQSGGASGATSSVTTRPVGLRAQAAVPLAVPPKQFRPIRHASEASDPGDLDPDDDDDGDDGQGDADDEIEPEAARPPLTRPVAAALRPLLDADALPAELQHPTPAGSVELLNADEDAEALMAELSVSDRRVTPTAAAAATEASNMPDLPTEVMQPPSPPATEIPKAATMPAEPEKVVNPPRTCVLILNEATSQLPDLNWRQLAEGLRMRSVTTPRVDSVPAECREVPRALHVALYHHIALTAGVATAAAATHNRDDMSIIVCSAQMFKAVALDCVGSVQKLCDQTQSNLESLLTLLSELQVIRFSID